VAGMLERMYMKSPIWLQQLAVTAWGIGWYRRRLGSTFRRLVHEFREREYYRADQFHQYQESQLGRVVDAAWHSPYYCQVFGESGIRRDMQPWQVLERAPLLTKSTLRIRPRDLLSGKRLPRGTKVLKSSGTTGTPVEIFTTREFHAVDLANCEVRNLNVGGASFYDRRVTFGARKVCPFEQNRPSFWRYSRLENMAYASIYHLSPHFIPAYLEFLRSYRPSFVLGFPSAIYTVAQYALEHDDLPAPVRCVSTNSETLSEEAREAIEAAFQCRVFDAYGLSEGCAYIGQCEHGRYHVSPDRGIVEILDPDGRPCPAGVLGELVCTGLHNTLQPLIRYRTGDAGRWAIDQQCPCGRNMPIMESVEGRAEDVCLTPDGRPVSRFTHVFKGMKNVRESQVVQEKPDLFVVYVVPTREFGDRDVKFIKTNMRLHVGAVETQVKEVHEIPRSSSGKVSATVCKLSPEERRRLLSLAVTPGQQL